MKNFERHKRMELPLKKKPFFKSMFGLGEKQAEKSTALVAKPNSISRLLDDDRHRLLFPEEKEISQSQQWASTYELPYGDDLSGLTIAGLMGTSNAPPRSRSAIYQQWRLMEKDPVISIALKTHVTAALGGHETSGDVVFIEDAANASEVDKKVLEEVRSDLSEMFNKHAFSVAYNALAFGDGYARTYYEKGKGLVGLVTDEMVHPTLILPYEQGGRTVGFLAGSTRHHLTRLTTLQIARMAMARFVTVPQAGMLSKSYKYNIAEDNPDRLPIVPAMIGGSLLFTAEKPFTDFYISLASLVGQRLVDAIDESFIMVNMSGGTREQQIKLAQNVKQTLLKSKLLADKAMQGEPQYGRIRHVLFTHEEKQVVTQGEGMGSRRQGSVSIEDIMLHARLLAGTLGIDLSMLGFADQLSGGLGDGGFFRMSAQIAESSRVIRAAMADFFIDLIDKHMLYKYGKCWNNTNRPFQINYYGSISAFESERQQTRANAIGSAGLISQTLEQTKNLGFSEKEMVLFMTKQMLLDQDEAELYAKAIISSQSQQNDY
ncbi:hypothetical protein [Avibacterium paragallinarum]|uniref:hypothetical protein n=2 Tax=Avibacterium paragallinarum TaxID=728 RepID=UPI00021ACDBB|nr:hypothetical protein [Avibacterium paragallinarum]QJE14412.1 hypothetical protein HHJ60_06770 [Avibacterium paragallinarum]